MSSAAADPTSGRSPAAASDPVSRTPSQRWETLVLARLSAASDGQTRADVGSALRTLCSTLTSFDAHIDRALDATVSAGLAASESRQRSTLVSITPAGLEELAARLRLDTGPRRVGWTALKDRHLVAVALDLAPLDARASADFSRTLCAEIAARALGLGIDGRATPAKVRDAAGRAVLEQTYGWTKLPARAPIAGEVGRRLLATLLGQPALRLSVDQLVRSLAVRALGCGRPGLLRAAVVRRWLEGTAPVVRGSLTPSATQSKIGLNDALRGHSHATPHVDQEPAIAASGAAREDDLAAFAARALAAGRASTSGQSHGGSRVFVSRVWQALREREGCDEATFKQRLLLAQGRGLLTLSRADMPAAFDAADVAASTIEHLGATFHFLRLEP